MTPYKDITQIPAIHTNDSENCAAHYQAYNCVQL